MTESSSKNYMFFSHRECEAFPCHSMKDLDNFNCLFCYCPLYMLGRECGGNFAYLENGMKDCTNCTIPHQRENYGAIVAKFGDIQRKMGPGVWGVAKCGLACEAVLSESPVSIQEAFPCPGAK